MGQIYGQGIYKQILKGTVRATPSDVLHPKSGCWKSRKGEDHKTRSASRAVSKYHLPLPSLETTLSVMQPWHSLGTVRDWHTLVGYEYSFFKQSSCSNELHPLPPCSKACSLASSAEDLEAQMVKVKACAPY